jgi:hypothetical protein
MKISKKLIIFAYVEIDTLVYVHVNAITKQNEGTI